MVAIWEVIVSVYVYLKENGPELAAIVLTIVALGEMVVALTPTKTDDLFMERVGKWTRKFFEVTKIPNRKVAGGKHKTLKEKNQNPTAQA